MVSAVFGAFSEGGVLIVAAVLSLVLFCISPVVCLISSVGRLINHFYSFISTGDIIALEEGDVLGRFKAEKDGVERTFVIRKLGSSDVKDAAAALANSFGVDPITSYLQHNKQFRRESLFSLCEFQFRCNIEGCYAVEWQEEQAIVGTAISALGKHSFIAELMETMEFMRWVAKYEFVHPGGTLPQLRFSLAIRSKFQEWCGEFSSRCYILRMLGVTKGFQGQKIGSSILKQFVANSDDRFCWSYLESSNKANVPLYERFGFQVVELFYFEDGCPPLWLMVRPPTKLSKADVKHLDKIEKRVAKLAKHNTLSRSDSSSQKPRGEKDIKTS